MNIEKVVLPLNYKIHWLGDSFLGKIIWLQCR